MQSRGPTGERAIPVSKLPAIFKAVVAACDHLDGLVDGQVDDPRRCRSDPKTLLCTDAKSAQPGFVIWLVMREVLVLLAIGLAIGIPAAMLLGRYVSSQLYGIQAHDPLIASSTTVLLTLVSAAAGFIPAQRASRIDPILALRHE